MGLRTGPKEAVGLSIPLEKEDSYDPRSLESTKDKGQDVLDTKDLSCSFLRPLHSREDNLSGKSINEKI